MTTFSIIRIKLLLFGPISIFSVCAKRYVSENDYDKYSRKDLNVFYAICYFYYVSVILLIMYATKLSIMYCVMKRIWHNVQRVLLQRAHFVRAIHRTLTHGSPYFKCSAWLRHETWRFMVIFFSTSK